jgi:hypothetical protein
MVTQRVLSFFSMMLLCCSVYAEQINFQVQLNDKDIGFHEFNVQNDTISNKAQFDVKLWFIPAYKYRHTATEVYKDNCLVQLQSETQDGADFFELSSLADSAFFKIKVNDKDYNHPACSQTFRYWDIQFTEQSLAINPQDGEIFKLSFSKDEDEEVKTKTNMFLANKYTLRAINDQDEKFHIELWYEQNSKKWIKLKSYLKDDNVITYVLND